MIPDLAPVIAVSVVVMGVGGTLVLRGPIGRALAERLAGRTVAAPHPEVDDLRGDVEDLRRQLGEMQERLDFAERLLAKQRVPDRLAPGARP